MFDHLSIDFYFVEWNIVSQFPLGGFAQNILKKLITYFYD